MSTPENLPTAQVLGALRRELVAEGFAPDVISDVVRMAAHELIENVGLGVQTATLAEMAQS